MLLKYHLNLGIKKAMKSKIANPSDPRVIKTKKQFKNAFKELVLLYDDYMDISIKELCDKANLNRKTFYLHYRQIDELFSELQKDAIEEFYDIIKSIDVFDDVEAVVKAFFEMNERNEVYQKINCSNEYMYMKDVSRKKTIAFLNERNHIKDSIKNDPVIQDFIVLYYHASISTMYGRWVKSNRPIPKDEMIALTTQLVKNGISSIEQ